LQKWKQIWWRKKEKDSFGGRGRKAKDTKGTRQKSEKSDAVVITEDKKL